MVVHAASTTRIVHADMTLTRSKVKLRRLLSFRQLPITADIQVYLLRHFHVELKTGVYMVYAFRSLIFEFPPRKAITRVQTSPIVAISRNSNGRIQGCSLGLDVSVSRRSFQTSRSRGNVGRSRSRSRLGLKIKCLGLVPQGLVYKPMCTAFCFIAKLHLHRFSERELMFTFAICCRPFVYLSVVCLCVMLVHSTQAVEIFANISTACGTLAIR